MEFLEGSLLKLMSNILEWYSKKYSGKLYSIRNILTNIAEKEYTSYGKLKKRIHSQVYIKDFVQKNFLIYKFFHRYFSRILLVDFRIAYIHK